MTTPPCFKSNPSPQEQAEHDCATCPMYCACLGAPDEDCTAANDLAQRVANGTANLVEVGRVGQSRSKSLLETVTSTAIGFVVSLLLTAAVMPAFGYPTTWSHDFWITVIFTVASIVRGYCVRRYFNG